MDDCLFCGIVAGKVPSQEVAATEHTFAFRDVQPAMPVHVLVVPRDHIGSAADITAEHGPGSLVELPAQAFIALVINSFPSALFHPCLDCHKFILH